MALFLIDMRIRYILLIVPSLVAVNGLWHFQYVPEYQAAAFAVRYIAFFRGLAWSLSLAVCAGQPAVQVL